MPAKLYNGLRSRTRLPDGREAPIVLVNPFAEKRNMKKYSLDRREFVLYAVAAGSFTAVFTSTTCLRAENINIGIDFAAIISALKGVAFDTVNFVKEENKERIKNSIALLSTHMIELAGLKRTFADLLDDKPPVLQMFSSFLTNG
jgi:hypothetical protein